MVKRVVIVSVASGVLAAVGFLLFLMPVPGEVEISLSAEIVDGESCFVLDMTFRKHPKHVENPTHMWFRLESSLFSSRHDASRDWDWVALHDDNPDTQPGQLPPLDTPIRVAIPFESALDPYAYFERYSGGYARGSVSVHWAGDYAFYESVEIGDILDDGGSASIDSAGLGSYNSANPSLTVRFTLRELPSGADQHDLRLEFRSSTLTEEVDVDWSEIAELVGLDPLSDPPIRRQLSYQLPLGPLLRDEISTYGQSAGVSVKLYWAGRFRAQENADISALYSW